ncbi:MAG: MBL fold metallo-hydrolase [Desulfopila sp.]
MVVQHTIDTPYPVGPVHCYTLESEDGLVLFDTGPPTETARDYLRRHIDLSRLRHILITHCHIDHYGLAYWLLKETDATLYLPRYDACKLEHHERRLALLEELMAGLGFDGRYLRELRGILASGAVFPPIPGKFKIDGLVKT